MFIRSCAHPCPLCYTSYLSECSLHINVDKWHINKHLRLPCSMSCRILNGALHVSDHCSSSRIFHTRVVRLLLWVKSLHSEIGRKVMSQIKEQKASNATLPVHPLQTGSMHVVRRLRRAFLSICRCGDVMFSPYRLTTEQYSLMLAVHRNPGIRQAEISDQIFAEPNTVTAMVTLLEKRGILRRKCSLTDGRVRLLFLTTHGQTVMQRLSADWSPLRKTLRQCFSSEDGQRALEILDEVFTQMQSERENLLQKSNPEFWMRPETHAAAAKDAQSDTHAASGRIKRAIKPAVRSAKRKIARSGTKPEIE
jgi:DNA-binding MarR family transcriptional regulator